jgi:hypothetical protein
MNQNRDQKNLMDCFKGITESFNRVGERLIIKGSVACLPAVVPPEAGEFNEGESIWDHVNSLVTCIFARLL